ncbi:zinc finger protein castor homolog 1-like [Pleurodeles waltl]
MSAKRKSGLKVNAICAKLRHQVDSDRDNEVMENAEHEVPDPSEKQKFLSRAPSKIMNISQRREDKKWRREAIEKWVNGECVDEPVGGEKAEVCEIPTEDVYIVKPEDCSDNEDNGGKSAAPLKSQASELLVKLASKAATAKDQSLGEAVTKQSSALASDITACGYSGPTMPDFLSIFGNSNRGVKDTSRKISFDSLFIPTSECGMSSFRRDDTVSKRVRISKYEKTIQKLKAGEPLGWLPQEAKSEEMEFKGDPDKNCGNDFNSRNWMLGMDSKATILPLPSRSSSRVQGVVSRGSKYDILIQNLKTGEALCPQNTNAYKKPSKYDLDNIKYLHLFKSGEDLQEISGGSPFKTGNVIQNSKCDTSDIKQTNRDKAAGTDPSLSPVTLISTPCNLVVTAGQTVQIPVSDFKEPSH